MRYPGTIGVSEKVFQAVLEEAAAGLISQGFKTVCFVGDSGGNQKAQAEAARRINRRFAKKGASALSVDAYYDPDKNGQMEWLLKTGEKREDIGTHAGIRDTSELLRVYPAGVRKEVLSGGVSEGRESGVSGNPQKASADYGAALLDLKVDAAVKQIRDFTAA